MDDIVSAISKSIYLYDLKYFLLLADIKGLGPRTIHLKAGNTLKTLLSPLYPILLANLVQCWHIEAASAPIITMEVSSQYILFSSRFLGTEKFCLLHLDIVNDYVNVLSSITVLLNCRWKQRISPSLE